MGVGVWGDPMDADGWVYHSSMAIEEADHYTSSITMKIKLNNSKCSFGTQT